MDKKLKRSLMVLPGFFLLAILLTKIPISGVIEICRGVKVLYLLSGIFLFIPMMLLKTLRWKIILENLNIGEKFFGLFQLSLLGFFMGVATPGQAGYFIKLWHMKKKGHSMKESLMSLMMDRIIDIFLFVVLAILGVFYFLNVFAERHQVVLLFFFGMLFFICLLFWVVLVKRQHFFRNPGVEKFLTKMLKQEKVQALQEMDNVRTDLVFLTRLGLVSVLEKVILFLRLYCIGLSLGISLDVLPFVYLMSIVTVIQLIPISIEGIGTRDVTMVFLLGSLGYTSAAALSFSFLILLVRIINCLPGFIVWVRRPEGNVLIEDSECVERKTELHEALRSK